MIDRFILYKIFVDTGELQLVMNLFKVNGIKYETKNIDIINDEIVIINEKGIIKILESKLDKADKLLKLYNEAESADKEIFFFDDTEIMKISLNNKDFDKKRVRCANKIQSIRFILMPFSKQMSLINKSNQKKIDPERAIINGANWFLWIGILSIFNIVAILFNQNLSFIVGLNYNYFFLGVMNGLNEATGINLMWLGYVLSITCSLLFVLIWNKSKNYNKRFYLTGLILYSIDTIPPLFTKQFFNFGFHVFALWILFVGYSQFKKMHENKPQIFEETTST